MTKKLKTTIAKDYLSGKTLNYNTVEEKQNNEPSLQDTLNIKLSTMQDVHYPYSAMDKLVDDIVSINDQFAGVTDKYYYKDQLPEIKTELDLTKKEVPVFDEEEVKKQAELDVTAEMQKEKDNLTQKLADDILKANESKLNAGKNYEEAKQKVESAYTQSKNNLDAEALSRGLARSSIALGQIKELDKQQADALSGLAVTLADNLTKIDEEIKSLNSSYNSSLNMLDLELATEIEKEIKQKTEEFKKAYDDAIEFNNNIEKLQANYKIDAQNAIQKNNKLESELAEQYKGIAEQKKQEAVLNAISEYVSKVDKDTAISELLTNKELTSLLPPAVIFDLYYKVIKGKK